MYNVGDLTRLSVTFTDTDNVPTNPTTVVLTILAPDGTESTPTPVSDGSGVYHFDLILTQSGIYTYRWSGTGTVVAVIEGSITVADTILEGSRPSPLDLTTLDFVKDYLAVPATSAGSDLLLQRLITRAGMFWLTETGLGPDDGSNPTVSPLVELVSYDEWLDGSGTVRQFVRHPPINTVGLVAINGSTIRASASFTASGYVIDSTKKSISLRCFGRFSNGTQNVNVQYQGGYNGTPYDVVQACTEMVSETFRKRNWIGQKSQALAAGGGTVTYVDWAISPYVRGVLSNYTRKALV